MIWALRSPWLTARRHTSDHERGDGTCLSRAGQSELRKQRQELREAKAADSCRTGENWSTRELCRKRAPEICIEFPINIFWILTLVHKQNQAPQVWKQNEAAAVRWTAPRILTSLTSPKHQSGVPHGTFRAFSGDLEGPHLGKGLSDYPRVKVTLETP